MKGPSARSLEECRKHGWKAQVVEKFIPQTRLRKDLFGCIDIVALDGKPGVLGIQATSTSNMSSRLQKICAECTDEMRTWLEAGNRLSVWGWAKRGPAGKRKFWVLKRHDIDLPELEWRSVLQ